MGATVTKIRAANSSDDTEFIMARAYVVITTLDTCKLRLEQQAKDAQAKWAKQLSDKTKEYREIMRDEDKRKASQKLRAGYFDEVCALLDERDALKDAATEDKKARKAKIAQIVVADAEAKNAHRTDSTQTTLGFDESRVSGMPWATDATLGVVYAVLLDLDERGVTLNAYQSALLTELGEAEVEGADLGLEAEDAIEDDSEVEPFESEDDEAVAEDGELSF